MASARRQVYLDHAATTPLDARVFDTMLPYLKEHFGNASSVHALGRKARFAVEDSRERLSAMMGVSPGEVIFTSGGTESNNAALKGAINLKNGYLLTSCIEHEAVLTQATSMQAAGRNVKILSPAMDGQVTLEQLKAHQSEDLAMISLMHANNEVGVLNDVDTLGAFCGTNDILYHTDAVQSAGWYDWTRSIGQVDLLSLSAHKFYGPKGVGCLIARRNAEVKGLIEGGSQERRRRGGTENVAGIVGMTRALELALEEREERVIHLGTLRALLLDGLQSVLPADTYVLNTHKEDDLTAPHIVNIAFPPLEGEPLDGEMLILNLDMEGVFVSSGSACTSGAIEPSHVLLGMGLDRPVASAAVRFSIGKDNTPDDIHYAVEKLGAIIARMRSKVSA